VNFTKNCSTTNTARWPTVEDTDVGNVDE